MKKVLIEKELNELAEKKEYIKVFNYFHDEYTELLKKFLVRHEIKIDEKDCLIDYIVKTRFFMPQYANFTIPITHAMYDETVPEEIKYSVLMESYRTIKDAFSK